MKRITEIKRGKSSVFQVETVIDGEIVDAKTVDVQVGTVEKDGKLFYVLYDSDRNIIEPAYMFLNHRKKVVAETTRSATAYNLRFLFSYCEIFNKSYNELRRDDFNRLRYFLKGISADDTDMELKLITIRRADSVNNIFTFYRSFYQEMNILVDMTGFAKNSGLETKDDFRIKKVKEVPKYISSEEFKKIVRWIRENIEDKERALRDECLVRVMYEGGLRLGEALGTTLEDYVPKTLQSQDIDICYVYIRNRISDNHRSQNAKTCMNVKSSADYRSPEYKTKNVGYQLSFLNIDTYDRICEYIDVAHERCRKEKKAQYDSRKADAVDEYKEKKLDNYYLFLNTGWATPLSEESWRNELRMIFQAVGIEVDYVKKEDGLSHRFRHGFCMRLLYDIGMPAYKVRIRSRHASEKGLEKYINPTTEQIVKEMEAIEKDILQYDEIWEGEDVS